MHKIVKSEPYFECKTLKVQETDSFIIFNKPSGFKSLKTNNLQLGLIDVLSEKLNIKLWPVYEMTPESSGLMLLAKSKAVANEIAADCKLTLNNSFITAINFILENKKFKYSADLKQTIQNTNSALTDLFVSAWQNLNNMYFVDSKNCFRLIHELNLDIQADIYGEILWVYWYKNDPPTELEQNEIFSFSKSIHKKTCIRHMVNRGYGVGGLELEKLFTSTDMPVNWIATENNIQYKLKQNSGFSPGLFLDQSENRLHVLKNSKEKNVLNLFSYTSGFSAAAALGKAKQVTTVDASPSFLEWSKENFSLNNLSPEKYEFYCQDTLLFLSGAKKRKRKWDLIICDPPSFGRTKTTIWKIEKDLPILAKEMWDCLSATGEIIFTCNYEKWNRDEVIKNFTLKLKAGTYSVHPLPLTSLDFCLPSNDSLTKGFRLIRI